jgi:hypothetical protein
MSDLANATHWIEIVSKQPGELGAHRLRDLAKGPIASQPTLTCLVCGTIVPVPDGNLRNHLQRRTNELGGEMAYVTFRIVHQPNVPLPPGTIVSRPFRLQTPNISEEELMESYVYPNPDPSKAPEEQERYKVRDLLRRQKEGKD